MCQCWTFINNVRVSHIVYAKASDKVFLVGNITQSVTWSMPGIYLFAKPFAQLLSNTNGTKKIRNYFTSTFFLCNFPIRNRRDKRITIESAFSPHTSYHITTTTTYKNKYTQQLPGCIRNMFIPVCAYVVWWVAGRWWRAFWVGGRTGVVGQFGLNDDTVQFDSVNMPCSAARMRARRATKRIKISREVRTIGRSLRHWICSVYACVCLWLCMCLYVCVWRCRCFCTDTAPNVNDDDDDDGEGDNGEVTGLFCYRPLLLTDSRTHTCTRANCVFPTFSYITHSLSITLHTHTHARTPIHTHNLRRTLTYTVYALCLCICGSFALGKFTRSRIPQVGGNNNKIQIAQFTILQSVYMIHSYSSIYTHSHTHVRVLFCACGRTRT